LRTITVANSGDAVGFREKGSAGVATWNFRLVEGANWFVIGLDSNGEYEIQTPGTALTDDEDVEFYEIGYILKSSSITTIPAPVDAVIPANNGPFIELDMGLHGLPEGTIMFGGWWDNTDGQPRKSMFRNVGSSEDFKKDVNQGNIMTLHSALNVDRKCEYNLENAAVKFFISWYETLPDRAAGSAKAGFDNACDAVAGFGVG